MSAWGNLTAHLTSAQHTVSPTIEKMLDLTCEKGASRNGLIRRLRTKEGLFSRDVPKCKTLEVELHDTKLKLELMEDGKEYVTDSN